MSGSLGGVGMEKVEQSIKKITVFVLAVTMIAGFVAICGMTSVSSAKKSGSVKTVNVKNAKKGMKITSGNYIYKITSISKKKSTVSVVSLTGKAKKKLTKVVIPKTVKIKSKKGKNKGTYSYKVTTIAKKAFKNNKKITNVTIGSNVETIEKDAFSGCAKLKKVVLSKSVKTINEAAFAGDKKLTEVVIPNDSCLEVIDKNAFKGCVKLKNINLANAKKLKVLDESAFSDTDIDKDELDKAKEKVDDNKYSYEIIPLMAPFNSYFYIKTDNPDPDTFRFVDESSVYAEENETGSISVSDTYFADVKYENVDTKRVKGGYIASGSNTDGGLLKVQLAKVTGSHNVYNLTTGETRVEKDYEYKDTDITVKVPELKNVVDYLISTFGDNSKSYFDNLSGIQKGFSSQCLYSGTYVLGDLKKSESVPYYGLSTSPHADQALYMQSPYYRTDSKAMLVSALYPMRYDSIGFPSIMSSVAKKLNSQAEVSWDSYSHYIVNVTYNGETKSFGGQGNGGGQGIEAEQIKYWYSFDGSKDDAYNNCNLADVEKMNREYGSLTVSKEPESDKPTWASIRSTVGTDGAYVKLVLITSIFGGSSSGYSYLYDNGSTSEGWGTQSSGAVGCISNAWFDGRYFNNWEYYYPGVTFKETVENVSPSIILKDVTIKLPDDGKKYYFNYSAIDTVEKYNPDTGVWKGMMTYRYDSDSKTWKASILNSVKYCEDGSWKYKAIEDQTFIDDCTITMDEALALNLDSNTNVEPSSYYIYDRVTKPGTYYSAK